MRWLPLLFGLLLAPSAPRPAAAGVPTRPIVMELTGMR